MFGWRARIGVLVPPGNPTVEPEFYLMAPAGVTIHCARLQGFQAGGAPGASLGMEARTLAYLDELSGPARALGSVNPAVFLNGTGLPTVAILETLEQDLKKPVISSNQASLWQALRLAGVRQAITGFGSLLREI
jgi:maleate cis-trans isomerase